MKALIFDFDGVVVDSLSLQIEAINEVAEKYGYRKIESEEEYRKRSLKELIDYLGMSWENVEMISSDIDEHASHKYDSVRMFPGVKESLKELSENFELIIVSSNSGDVITDVLSRCGLEDFFDQVSAANGLFEKSKVLKDIAEERGTDDLVFVGDEVRDVKAAKEAGIKTVCVSWGFDSAQRLLKEDPDYLLESTEELTSLTKTI